MYMYEYRKYANEYVTQPAGLVFITLRYDLRQKRFSAVSLSENFQLISYTSRC